MTKDFSKHQKIVDQFRGQVLSSDFEKMFTSATANVAKTERFLLKMELKRLASSCTRLIDLRGHVDGECRSYEYENKIHFLDDTAIRCFEDNIKAYGSYTFGVYEAVTNTENNFRVIYQKEKQNLQVGNISPSEDVPKVFEKTQYPAQLFKFGQYFNRNEERMNFAIQLEITFSEGNVAEVTSSDLSVNGCKFRFIGKEKIRIGQEIGIRFVGLEQEFQFGKEALFSYKVCSVQLVDNIQLIGTSRIYAPSIHKDSFKSFLEGFIQGNKRRYKINLDNSINALQARSFEQFSLPKINELPIYIEEKGGELSPRFALTCNNNQTTYQYWQNEQRLSTLDCLITEDRMKSLKKRTMLGKSLLVYSFIHKSQGKLYFYTADEVQLNNDMTFMQHYLGFCSSKSSFAVTELSLIDVITDYADSPLTLSNSILKKDEYLNLLTPEDVKFTLEKLPYIVIATDITENYSTKEYQQLAFDDIEISRLKNFGHKRMAEPLIIDEVGINYRNQRQESRFKYKTPTIIEVGGVKWKGLSHDFSMSGLKVELEKAAMLKKGDVVQLSFPTLQKITSAFDLKFLPYEIVKINSKKTIINLRIYVEQHQHIGRAFFKLLIDKNRDKLTPDEYSLMTPGLAKALRNIYSASLRIPSLVVQTSGSRYKIETIVGSGEYGSLLPMMRQLSDRQQGYNLYPILSNLQVTNSLHSTLKKMQRSDSAITEVLYISINPNVELVDKAVVTKLGSELESMKLKDMFISNALNKGLFFCLQIKLSRADEPDMGHLSPELNYISSYAIHRGKQIEQDIWSVVGLIQVIDVTHEALLRHRIMSKLKKLTS